MTYTLILGDYAYSSWSLRGWLLFEKFGIPHDIVLVDFHADGPLSDQMPGFAPAVTVPTMRTPEGAIVSDSLAIAEELASRHPHAGVWPADPLARATARTLAAEMHSGFSALRSACPMNLRTAYTDTGPSDAVRADLRRIETIWEHARATCGATGPWLCGEYSAADAFFAPVAARIAGYDLPVGAAARTYVDAHLSDPAFRRWRAMGLVRGETLPRYAKDHPTAPWPGPAPMSAQAVDAGPSQNATCPYSDKPVTHFLRFDGRIYGFCNAFCRDKTAADPEAWPAFMALTK
jgi:glutathione S-transferase